MAFRVVLGAIVAIVSALCAGACSSDSGRTEAPPSGLEEETLDLGDGVTMKLVLIPAGEFMMGSHESAAALAKAFDTDAKLFKDEHPQHPVKITRPFYLGVYEVTQQQYEKVMGDKPWSGDERVEEGPEYPATCVSWNDAQEFCRELSSKEGRTYRLPTEAEWEYACRAGSKTRYCCGDGEAELDDNGDGESELGTYAWSDGNVWNHGEKYGHRVGLKLANAWGLYDMHGNVFEWCQDRYTEDYYENSPAADPTGPTSRPYCVSRSGCWLPSPRYCRSAHRYGFMPGYRFYPQGFRVVLVPAE